LLGLDHPDVGHDLSRLAELHRVQGKHAEAQPFYRRSVAIFEKAGGSHRLNMATSLSNLAFFHHTQGQYAEAEPLYKRALAIFETSGSAGHPNAKLSLDNLAKLYRATDQSDIVGGTGRRVAGFSGVAE
jgi:tetratricopeptide (TPR) repeat protein